MRPGAGRAPENCTSQAAIANRKRRAGNGAVEIEIDHVVIVERRSGRHDLTAVISKVDVRQWLIRPLLRSREDAARGVGPRCDEVDSSPHISVQPANREGSLGGGDL